MGPDGLPTKVQRGHTARNWEDDPFGEPRSIPFARPDGPWGIEGIIERTPVSELRGRALSAIETMPGASTATRENATRMIESSTIRSGTCRAGRAAGCPSRTPPVARPGRAGLFAPCPLPGSIGGEELVPP